MRNTPLCRSQVRTKREGTICPGASGPLNGVGVPSLLRWPSTSRPRVARGEAAGQPRRRGVTRDDPGRLPASSGEHRTPERAVYVTAAPENGDGRGPLSRTREAERQGHAVYVTAASTGTSRPTVKRGTPHKQATESGFPPSPFSPFSLLSSSPSSFSSRFSLSPLLCLYLVVFSLVSRGAPPAAHAGLGGFLTFPFHGTAPSRTKCVFFPHSPL